MSDEVFVPVSENVVGRTVLGAGPAIVSSPEMQWLLRRREMITASDVAAIIGEHPTRKPSDVYLEKLGRSAEIEEFEQMKWGRRFEAGIGAAYAEVTGRAVRAWPKYEIAVHPDIPWLGATLDFEAFVNEPVSPLLVPAPAGGDGAVETKATGQPQRWAEGDTPTEFELQLQTQCACRGLKWGSLVAFVSMYRPPVWVDRIFDKELFDEIVPQLERFRWHVLHNEPVLDNPDWWSDRAVKRVWSADSGESIRLDEAGETLVRDWRAAKAAEKGWEERVEDLGKQVRLLMGNASAAYLSDGDAVVRTIVKDCYVPASTRSAHSKLSYKSAKKGKK
jgi:putative phage-type endonuclease